jgi:NAD(P)-dependent dehydrogenase (short-subunit alcohol dehydrogenase family)
MIAGEVKGCKGEMHVMQCDVTKEEDVIRVVKWTRDNLGGADVLVNNAGIGYRSPLTGNNSHQNNYYTKRDIITKLFFYGVRKSKEAEIEIKIPVSDINTAQMKQTLDLNVFGLCMFTREVIKDMRSRDVDDGHIFHISRYVIASHVSDRETYTRYEIEYKNMKYYRSHVSSYA